MINTGTDWAREQARLDAARRRERAWRWVAFVVGVLLALLITATAAHAQNGLYRPEPVPVVHSPPFSYGGLLLDADSIVEMDTTLAVQYHPPEEYREWWVETVVCAMKAIGQPGNTLFGARRVPRIEEYAFVTVDAPAFRVHGAGPFVGYTLVDKQTILLPRRYLMNRLLVRHEMLHAILYAFGRADYGHPRADWIFRACGVANQ